MTYQPPPSYVHVAAPKKSPVWPWIIGVFVALVMGVVIGASSGWGDEGPASRVYVTETVSVTRSP